LVWFLEENLAELIRLQFHDTVSNDKNGFHSALHRRELTIEELITKANKPNLKSTIESLFTIFEILKRSIVLELNPAYIS
jgi:hypothetical protein